MHFNYVGAIVVRLVGCLVTMANYNPTCGWTKKPSGKWMAYDNLRSAS